MIRYPVLLLIASLFCQSVTAQSPEQLRQMRKINPDLQQPGPIDQKLVDSNGIQTFKSRHLILFTDLKGRDDIEELPGVFDAAVEQWCEYFAVDSSRTKSWQLRGMIIADRDRFVRAKLFPADLPDFPAGFQRGHEMWVYLQRGNYYTRHLLLHEGTHSFMQWFLGGTGAPWYTEGMAELLGVHQWKDGRLKLNYHLQDRSEAEYWGRIKVITEDCQAGSQKSIDDVLNFPPNVFREVRYYAWSWAACEFFSKHPKSKEAFKMLQGITSYSPGKFNHSFLELIEPHRMELERDWNLFVNEIDFGYDIERGILRKTAASDSLSESITVDSRYSWQESSIAIRPGDAFEFTATGRFNVGSENGIPWPCEAGGVTIDYYRGQPLGRLMLGVIVDDSKSVRLTSLQAVGLKQKIRFDETGTLCFRVNESPSSLADNEGQLKVTVKKIR